MMPQNLWLSDTLRTQRSNLRAAERKWHKSAALDDLASYQTLLASFSSSITAAKKTFFNDKINGATDARKLFSTFKTLLYPPPPATNLTADNFASFFTEKVAAIGKQFDQLSPPPKGATVNGSSFLSFIPLSESEILTGSRPPTCPRDPTPSNILQAISPAVLPAITQVINASFNSGTFPSLFEVAPVMSPLR